MTETNDQAEAREEFTVTIKDREVVFLMPTDGQVAQLSRAVNVAQRSRSGETMVPAVARMLDVLMAMVKDDDDRDFLDDGMVSGDVLLDDMMVVMRGIIDSNEEKAPTHGPVKTASRGRR